MRIRIQVLVENTTPIPGLAGEYGFAALVECDGDRFLFDTGSAGALIGNARQLKAGLEGLQALIISHGHFDHTGAALTVAKQNPGLPVYGHSSLFGRRFVTIKADRIDEIGASFSAAGLLEAGAVFVPADDFMAIKPGIYVTGPIPRTSGFEDPGAQFWKGEPEELAEDRIDDEIALVIDHPQGLILLSGCAHAGLINTLRYAMEKTGRKRILLFLGGTHLMNASAERMAQTVAALKSIEFTRLAVSHCTGFNAAAELRGIFGDRVVKAEAGTVFRFQ